MFAYGYLQVCVCMCRCVCVCVCVQQVFVVIQRSVRRTCLCSLMSDGGVKDMAVHFSSCMYPSSETPYGHSETFDPLVILQYRRRSWRVEITERKTTLKAKMLWFWFIAQINGFGISMHGCQDAEEGCHTCLQAQSIIFNHLCILLEQCKWNVYQLVTKWCLMGSSELLKWYYHLISRHRQTWLLNLSLFGNVSHIRSNLHMEISRTTRIQQTPEVHTTRLSRYTQPGCVQLMLYLTL